MMINFKEYNIWNFYIFNRNFKKQKNIFFKQRSLTTKNSFFIWFKQSLCMFLVFKQITKNYDNEIIFFLNVLLNIWFFFLVFHQVQNDSFFQFNHIHWIHCTYLKKIDVFLFTPFFDRHQIDFLKKKYSFLSQRL